VTAERAAGALALDVVELRRGPGVRRSVDTVVDLDGLTVGDRRVVGGRVRVDLEIEVVGDDLVVDGRLGMVTRVPCRRCLEDVDEEAEVVVREIFESDPTDGETWPITDERIDLEPVVREAALLALPLVPLCRDDCVGPEPERFPTGPTDAPDPTELATDPPRDPRWAALDDLDLG